MSVLARLDQMRQLQQGLSGLRDSNLRKAWGAWHEMAFGTATRQAALSRYKRGFSQWKVVSHRWRRGRRLPPTDKWKMVKPMTWRECGSWLQRLGISTVSQDPPTLIRALKEGLAYQNLVRKVWPAYYVRHKVPSCSRARPGRGAFPPAETPTTPQPLHLSLPPYY